MTSTDQIIVRRQATPLTGAVSVPGDKSISHRAVMLAALADGPSIIRNWLPAGDTLATLEVMRALGVGIEIVRHSSHSWDLFVEGRGLRGLKRPSESLNCRNAGTAIRLLAGLMAGQSFPSVLEGSEQLRKRPMRRVTEPLRLMGADIKSDEGHAPLTIRPSSLHGIEYKMEVASAQVKSSILLAGLYANNAVRVYEPGPARDHTERLLIAMGTIITKNQGWVTLGDAPLGGRRLLPVDMTVPGDFSSAAFPLVAAAIVPHSRITIKQVGVNATRTGLLDILRAMGADITISNQHVTGGELIADVSVSHTELHATEVDGALVVRAIDEFPIWAVATTQAAGDSVARDAAELRVKEVDRIAVLAGELRRLGVSMDEREDGFAVRGPQSLRGAEVYSHNDHRLGMALAVAGLVAEGTTLVDGATCMADSFPGFIETMQQLGASLDWAEDSVIDESTAEESTIESSATTSG
ncbi:MAG: 3-phosphoshikimate 1-carboxyvinyltransferase [Candidatus Promineofilum sp.]|nr:3-phosphoshikimate 1-carboxyvinyltransferase [Promineifilum sp.]MBP9657746.1 3-phosphoshikimate 1-carboxyvinyltransferase [Promineifilum sp.]